MALLNRAWRSPWTIPAAGFAVFTYASFTSPSWAVGFGFGCFCCVIGSRILDRVIGR